MSGQKLNIVVIRYEADGDIVSGFPVTYNNFGQNGNDYPVDLAFDSGLGVWVGGVSDGVGTATDYVLIGWSSSGSFLDVERFDGSDHKEDELVDIEIYPVLVSTQQAVGISVTGTSYSDDTLEDIVTIHYHYSGGLTEFDKQTYLGAGGPSKEFASALTTGASGGDYDVFVCGYSNELLDNENHGLNYVVLGYPARGSDPGDNWVFLYDRPTFEGDDLARRINLKQLPDNSGSAIYVTGDSWGGSTNISDVVTLALDRLGDPIWTSPHIVGGSASDEVIDMTAVDLGDVYLMTRRFNGSNYDFRTVKIDADDGTDADEDDLWETSPVYNAPPYGGLDEPLAIRALVPGLNPRVPHVYIAGRSYGLLDSTMKYAIVKYEHDEP